VSKLSVFESSPSIPVPERPVALSEQRADVSGPVRTSIAPPAPSPVPSPASPPVSPSVSREASPETRAQGHGETRTPPTARTPLPVIDRDLLAPDLYLNRELTWLSFNLRVLQEGEDRRTPLLERVKFLAITASNLDEFFMKRIGGLKQQEGARMPELTVDGRTPVQQINESYRMVRVLEERMHALMVRLFEQLREHDIVVARYDSLSREDRAALRQYYLENIFPLVTPQAIDPAHPFPFVSNLSLNLMVTLPHLADQMERMVRIKVPVGAGIPRFLRVGNRNVFVPLEEVMGENLDLLFPGLEIDRYELFRVTRNAITELDEEEADDLLEMIEAELRERKFAPIVRMQVARGMSDQHRGMLASELGLDEAADVFEIEGMLGKTHLWELARLDIPELKDPPHHPINPPDLLAERNVFHIIRDAGSILLQHPYESFATSVERFLREASTDPKVRAIKMTLYRTSSDSRVIEYLIDAARNGKQVAVVLELKARFDEAANIRWANHLEQVGIHVTYGVVGLKTHCKVILVVRQDYNGLRRYAHISTGNYHAGTARQYSDIGLLTCDDAIGHDLTELFNYLTTGFKPRRNYLRLLPAPKLLKQALLDKIQREIRAHGPESPGLIQMKMNALEDADITRALYQASQAGVKIDLIVRDTCRLRPGVPGMSENITVISVVGRFLEHARIFYFRNGGNEEYYIGSADCMKRNLESRIEVVAPVDKPSLRAELRVILDTQLADQRSAWVMQPDGSYVQRRPPKRKSAKSCQQAFIDHAEKRHRDATRLKRRQPRGIARRRLRPT
jgi:polyphosphate kinase